MADGLKEISCRCGNKIVRKSADGIWRFSSKVFKSLGDGQGVTAVCRCGLEVEMPIHITMIPRGTIPASPIPAQRSFRVITRKSS